MIGQKNIHDLQKIIDETKEHDVLVFKHSKRCSISVLAKSKFDAWLNKNKNEFVVIVIDVISEHELSQQFQRYFGISHESPQLICFRNNSIIWHASHFEICNLNLNKYLSN